VRLALPGHVLLPGLVNAHTHLDLTHLGPLEWDPERPFTDWVAHIRAGRRTDPEAIAASVRAGAQLAIAGGTAIVGDISGAVRAQPSLHAARALADTGLRGVSFVEFFAVGPRAALNVAGLSELLDSSAGPLAKDLRLGLQPHATNTVDPEAYLAAVDFAVQWGLPLATHLAESAEEREFIARATGPQRHLLESVGAWEDSLARVFGQGKHPVAHLQTALKEARTAYRPFLAAHVNDATDEALELLAATKTSVAYCPRASDYFGAHRHFGPHRYRDMLRAGINVCLGTDSIVNITDGTAGPGEGPARLSVLDEMRFLHRRWAWVASTSNSCRAQPRSPSSPSRFHPLRRRTSHRRVPTPSARRCAATSHPSLFSQESFRSGSNNHESVTVRFPTPAPSTFDRGIPRP
jgi:cytosine/adenosine deaminase-related metal-dependent hydrolase